MKPSSFLKHLCGSDDPGPQSQCTCHCPQHGPREAPKKPDSPTFTSRSLSLEERDWVDVKYMYPDYYPQHSNLVAFVPEELRKMSIDVRRLT